MKNYITPSYTFTPGASGVGTIDTNIVNFNIKLLVGIINITRETPIYWPALAGRGFTNVSGDVITLEYDTSTHNAGDVLQFIYDSTADYPVFSQVTNFPATQPVSGSVNVGNFPATQPVSGSVSVSNFPATQPVSGPLTNAELAASEVVEALRQIQMEVDVLKNTIGQTRVDAGGRLRILLDSISASLTLATVTTVTTVSTVTNQTQIGGTNANDQVSALRRAAADTLLSKITIS